MQRRAIRSITVAALTAVPIAIIWATPTPPVSKTGAPGETTCSSCHGGAGGGGSVVVTSTSGMTSYTPGASKQFTVTVSGSGNAGFELTARPASNLSGGVAGNLVAGSTTNVVCRTGTVCATGNPQYIRSIAAAPTPATFTFNWTPPTGTEDVTLYVAGAVGYGGNTYSATYLLHSSGGVTPPTLSVTPSTLSFAYQIGGTAPAAKSLAISGVATTYTAAASGGAWLSVSPASGGTSGSASVSVNTAGLAAGTYNGSVTVTAAGSTGSPKSVPVTLTVTPATPTLTVTPTSLTFAYQIGGTAPGTQTLAISGVASTYTAAASGGTWLSVSPASGGTSGSASVSVNPAGLAAGSYSGSVTITASGSTGSPKSVPVTLSVTATAPTLTLNPTSLTFAYQIGGAAPAAQTVNVSGVASTFTASSSGGAWLSISSTSGSVRVTANPAGLAAGVYNGSVTVTAAGSAGSPKTVPVTFNVTPAPTLTVSPSSLTFTAQIGGAAAAAQTIAVTGPSLNYTVAVSGGAWLVATPTAATTPGSVSVSVDPTGLAAGSYSGSVTITAPGATNGAQVVTVGLTLLAAIPTLQVTPQTLSFSCATGNAGPMPYTIHVSSTSTALNYTATDSAAWLSVAPASGATPGAFFASINPAGLAAGTYNSSITITSTDSPRSTLTVPVTLTVSAGTNACLVTRADN